MTYQQKSFTINEFNIYKIELYFSRLLMQKQNKYQTCNKNNYYLINYFDTSISIVKKNVVLFFHCIKRVGFKVSCHINKNLNLY